MTSRSEGSSDETSEVSLSRWREDMSGKGAELSSPRRERMSWRISLTSWGSFAAVCSLRRAGMLFWPTYRVVSLLSGSAGQMRTGRPKQSRAPGQSGARTVCADGLTSVLALPPGVGLGGRASPLLPRGRVVRCGGEALPGGRPVRLIRAELRVLPLDAVLAGVLVVALDFPLPARPARGAWTSMMSNRRSAFAAGARVFVPARGRPGPPSIIMALAAERGDGGGGAGAQGWRAAHSP